MDKDSFILYKSFYGPIKNLSDKQLGRLFRALFDYQIEGSTQVDADLQMAFAFFKNQMDIDAGKYQKVVERNKRNGLKGGRPPKEENPKNPVGLEKPKKPDNDNDNGNDNDNDKEKKFNKKDFRDCLLQHGVDPQHINDWFAVRDKSRAPYTKTVLRNILKECKNHNFSVAEAVKICAERGWRGFQYEWIKRDIKPGKTAKQSTIQNNEW